MANLDQIMNKLADDIYDQYEVVDLMPTVRNTWSRIVANDGRIVCVRLGVDIYMLLFHFKTGSNITSGTCTLPNEIPYAATEVYAPIYSQGNHGGFVQLTGRTLYIRTTADSTYYLNAQLIVYAQRA